MQCYRLIGYTCAKEVVILLYFLLKMNL